MFSGIVLCLISLYMLQGNERPEARPVVALPEAVYEPEPVVESWMLQGWTPAPTREPGDVQVVTNEGADEDPGEAPTAPIVRVRVPRVGIDAPVDVKSVDGSGAMQDPEGPVAVAWYDFSAKPGTVGNIVMAGHVDYHDYGPAVFWELRNLKSGDRVEVTLADGQTFIYEVASMDYYSASSAPVDEIVGATPYEALTMITCGGSFDSSRLEYNERLIVRAKRVTTTASSSGGAGS